MRTFSESIVLCGTLLVLGSQSLFGLEVDLNQPPVGRFRTTDRGSFLLELRADGTGVHYDRDLVSGRLSNPSAIRWSTDENTRDPKAFPLTDPRLDKMGCRMHLNENGNLSVRGNTEGELWVLKPE